jgi:putative ABC transport system permease protein
VLRLAVRETWARRTASVLATLGLLTATFGFIVLANTSETAQASLRGDIGRAWSTPYDLLVRPPGSMTALEKNAGLVSPNFLSNISGGITMTQLQVIRQIPGVTVAAPLAVMGFVNWASVLEVDLSKVPRTGDLTVFHVSTTETGDAGLSQYPLSDLYVVVQSSSPQVWPVGQIGQLECGGGAWPASLASSSKVLCFGPTPWTPPTNALSIPPPDHPAVRLLLWQPIVIAGIDPQAESEIARLDRCVTSGRYLSTSDIPTDSVIKDPTIPPIQIPKIPVIVSDRSFVQGNFNSRIELATDPASVSTGTDPSTLAGWLPVESKSTTADDLYAAAVSWAVNGVPVEDSSSQLLTIHNPDGFPLWSLSRTSYEQTGPNTLQAQPSTLDLSVYNTISSIKAGPYVVPPEAKDTIFHSITQHQIEVDAGPASTLASKAGVRSWEVVGQYNPGCIPGFSPLAGGHLEAYSYPAVRLSNGSLLGPNRALTGYVSSPPLLLTTMAGAQFFADPRRFAGASGDAFISVIRVKIAGVTTPGPVSEARLARAAAAIHQATGLDIDIVKGGSPETVNVSMPAGRFGRPALTAAESWSVKGVAVRFSAAVTSQNLALFTLVVLGASVLVGQTSYMAVRRRRTEFGVLRALGWPSWRVAWLVELEMLLLGVIAGLVSFLLGGAIATLLHVGSDAWRWVGAVPLAVGMAGVAAAVPAVSASRGSTRSIMAGSGGGVRRSRTTSSVLALAARDLRFSWLSESLLGVAVVALGAFLLGAVVLVEAAFKGQLDTTVLGTYLSGQVQPFHIALAALTLIIAALAAAEIVALSYLDRRPQFAALRAMGWPASRVLRLLAAQGLIIGSAGGLVGTTLLLGFSHLVGAPADSIGYSALAAGVAAIAATGLACVVPLWLAYRLPPADALRGE